MKALIGFIGFICPAWGADELAFLGMRSAACHRFEIVTQVKVHL